MLVEDLSSDRVGHGAFELVVGLRGSRGRSACPVKVQDHERPLIKREGSSRVGSLGS